MSNDSAREKRRARWRAYYYRNLENMRERSRLRMNAKYANDDQFRSTVIAAGKKYRSHTKEARREYLNRPEVRARQNELRRKNRQRNIAEFREQDKVRYRKKTAAQRESSRIVHLKSAKRRRQQSPGLAALAGAKERARKRLREFTLTKQWVAETYTGKCQLTGLPFIVSTGLNNAYSPSIDRIDPAKGYTPDNCRFILWAVNRFKMADTDETMFSIASALVAHGTK